MNKNSLLTKKKCSTGKVIGILLLMLGSIMLSVFALSAYKNFQAGKRLSQLQQIRDAASADPKTNPSDIFPEYREMHRSNSDFVGWIVINGTDINYPVVQSRTYQEFYLNHDFDGEEYEGGAIFVDARNDYFTPDDNIIIYGHNMKDGSMFGTLQYYLKQDYYKEHQIIQLDTLFERKTYKIALIGLSAVTDENEDTFRYYDFLNFKSKKAFLNYVAGLKKLQVYDTGVDIKYGDKLVTLSTCNSRRRDGRLFLVAKEITDK